MKKNIHIVIIESSDVLYEGLSTILYHSDDEYYISRLFGFEELELVSSSKEIDMLFISPIMIFNNEKEIRKIRKQFPDLLIAGVNINIIDNKTLALYDLTFNIYDNSNHILSVLKKQLEQKQNVDSNVSESEILSDRETQVLLQLIKGLTNKEIAEILNISVHTVISHRKNIMLKTGIRSQAGLALYAMSKSLISLDDFDF